MQIKTLAQILAADQKKDAAAAKVAKPRPSAYAKAKAKANTKAKTRPTQPTQQPNPSSTVGQSRRAHSSAPSPSSSNSDSRHNDNNKANSGNSQPTPKRQRKKRKSFHPAAVYRPKTDLGAKAFNPIEAQQLKAVLTQAAPTPNLAAKTDVVSPNASKLDTLPAALTAYLKTPEQRQAEKEEIKANSRLRWLAFYYLSRREHSAAELRQKLLAKEQDPVKIAQLLTEFQEKGYQSDYRTALMLIREGIRKRHGRLRIKNDFYQRQLAQPSNIDELIDMAMADNEAFVDVVSDNDLVEGVDWLRLAVEARVKKYGAALPSEAKEKARQLRFLQYRGFKADICFAAIAHNLDTLDARF